MFWEPYICLVTTAQFQEFSKRIDQLTLEHKPTFGKMSTGQMVCHCTDQLRLAFGSLRPDEDYIRIDPKKVRALALSGKTVPTPKGLDQVKGGGTKPTTLENDKLLLKAHLQELVNLPEDYAFAPHPYFGPFDKKRWTNLTIYHLNHHLAQFNV